jgi:hypothetical protein
MTILVIILVLIIFTCTYFALVFLLRLTRIQTTSKSRLVVFGISGSFSLAFTWYFLFYNSAGNLKTAYIEESGEKYTVTILGRRNYMPHDPISLLQKPTYLDSAKFIVPRAKGPIDGLEIPSRPGSYKIAPGEAMVLTDGTIRVTLFYDNYDDKTLDPSTWNGEYKLEWRHLK